MKKILMIVLLCCVQWLSAQSLKVGDTVINGKKYWVYPYVFAEYQGDDTPKLISHFELPPVIDSLNDGDYVLMQSKYSWKRKKQKIKKTVRAYFSIKNGVLDGDMTYYDRRGILFEKGKFTNGLEEGEWNTYFSSGKIKEVLSYKKGIPYGMHKKYEMLGENYFLALEYFQESTYKFSKYYKGYYPNGQLMIESYSDTAVSLSAKGPSGYFTYPIGYTVGEIKGKLQIKKGELKFNYQTPSDQHPFNFYHPNGQLLGKISSSQNSWNYNAAWDFDTLYNFVGRAVVIKKTLSDTLGEKRFVFHLYDKNGVHYSSRYFISSKINQIEEYRYDELKTDGVLHVVSNRLDPNYDPLKHKRDSCYVVKIDTSLRYSNVRTTYYCNNNTGNFDRVNELQGQYSVDFKVLVFGKNKQYQKSLNAGDIKIVAHFSSFDKKEERMGFPSFLYRSEALLLEVINRSDSIKVYYKNKPFSGKLFLVNAKNAEDRFTVNDTLIICTTSSINESDTAEISFVNGEVKYYRQVNYYDLKKKVYHVRKSNYYPFENNVVHGNVLYTESALEEINNFFNDYEYRPRRMYWRPFWKKKKLSWVTLKDKTENYWYGLKHGVFEEQFSDRSPQSFNTYIKGTIVGTSLSYDYDQQLESVDNYDMNGKLHGSQKSFTRGLCTSESFYNHGVQEGFYYSLHGFLDTNTIAYYKDDVLHGPFERRFTTYNYLDNSFINYVVKGNAVNGRLKGDFVLMTKGADTLLHLFISESDTVHWSDIGDIEGGDYKIWHDVRLKAYCKMFRANNLLYSEGEINNFHSAGQYNDGVDFYYKKGKWQYFDVLGNKVAEVNYFGKSVPVKNTTAYTNGDVTEYYTSGKLKYKGQLYSEDAIVECEEKLHPIKFNLLYDLYLSPKGDTIVKNGTGYLKVYDVNGYLLEEGRLDSNQENGWWKGYNREGILVSVGKYMNGKKEGRWLYGDLTGINYLDDKCFKDEEARLMEQEENKFDIQIREELFEDGRMMRIRYFSFKRSGN